MALTEELLKRDEQLKGLSAEQIAAVVALSKNDEDSVVGTRFAQLHNDLDAAIKEASGVDKTTNEKTSSYLKRVLGSQKTSMEELNGKVTKLESEKTELESKIAAGSGDKELIETQKATIADLTTKFNTIKEEKDKMDADHKAALLDMRISTELNGAMGEIAFKNDANAEIVNVLKAQAMNTVKGMKPTYVKDDKGVDHLIFKDENGAELRNPDNGLNLYTAKELLTKELTKFGIVEDKKVPGGAGGGSSVPKPSVNVTGAKTKTEFHEIAENMAHSQGLTRGTKEHDDYVDKVVEDNKAVYDALPFQ